MLEDDRAVNLLLVSRPFSIFKRSVKRKRDNPPGIAGLMRMDGEGYACKARVFSVLVLGRAFIHSYDNALEGI